MAATIRRRIIETLKNAQGSLLVACHRTPDGDTLGAGLAVCLWLRELGKDARVYCADPVPAAYRFLPGAGYVSAVWGDRPAVAVAVDCAGVDRIHPDGGQLLAGAGLVINIDHHATNPHYGTLNHIVDDAGSTCELVAEMLLEDGRCVNKDIADCLYTGIVTDTGQFAFDYTRPESLRTAARLMECGAAFESICSRVFRARSLSKTRLIAAALSSLRLFASGKIALVRVPQAMLQAAGSSADECENIVNFTVEIDGVEVGILLRETVAGEWKVSYRSSGDVDVSVLAKGFGGGGHRKAAGCTLPGPADEAERRVVEAAQAAITGT